ncbi:MAG: thiamine pyrophosphate-dependent dehydrogenase E1 component subunit alpha, partial [Acidobacteria bacterium]|nr:thiamine pyrophosphate-dependent dehydrogenase E1 component subunit alpha [Acidobacteriota bacterium]
TGCAGGKGGQMHLQDLSVGAPPSNAIVGANVPIATGAALGFQLRGLDRVAVSFFGDGAANIGAVHEGINLAAVKAAPVIFVCENNLYAASTHIALTSKVTDLAQRAAAYGIPGEIVDGNDVLEVHAVTKRAVERARAGGGPTLIEAKTFRMKGHAEHDDAGYVPPELFEHWRRRDPLDRFERHLLDGGIATAEELAGVAAAIDVELVAEMDFALASPMPPPERALEGVYAR